MAGVSHTWAQERAVLPEIARRSGKERVADMIGHCGFGGLMIVHACQDQVFMNYDAT